MGEILMVDKRSVWLDVEHVEVGGLVYVSAVGLAHQFAEIAKDLDLIVNSQELSRFFLAIANRKGN